jgi:hypothetical protein
VIGAAERHIKDTLCTWAAATTWADEIPLVLLGLGSQPMEDTGLSAAEAVDGVLLVLPKEFLQVKQFSVDQIVDKFQNQRYSCIL